MHSLQNRNVNYTVALELTFYADPSETLVLADRTADAEMIATFFMFSKSFRLFQMLCDWVLLCKLLQKRSLIGTSFNIYELSFT